MIEMITTAVTNVLPDILTLAKVGVGFVIAGGIAYIAEYQRGEYRNLPLFVKRVKAKDLIKDSTHVCPHDQRIADLREIGDEYRAKWKAERGENLSERRARLANQRAKTARVETETETETTTYSQRGWK